MKALTARTGQQTAGSVKDLFADAQANRGTIFEIRLSAGVRRKYCNILSILGFGVES